MQKLTFLLIMTILFACQSKTGNKNKDDILVEDNTTNIDKNSTVTIEDKEVEDIQKEKFMDFFSSFMWDKDFQKNRIVIPIQSENEIFDSRDSWIHKSYYTTKDFIPIIHTDTLTYYDTDIDCDSVMLSRILLSSQKIENNMFKCIKGKWKLFEIKSENLTSLSDILFLNFLVEFSLDSVFQIAHTQFPLPEFFVDYDNDYEIAFKHVTKDSWNHLQFQKSLEGAMTFNLNNESDYRMLFFRGVENGISLKYTFQLIDRQWKLIKIVDLSM